jgi:Mitochondrial protein Pet127
MDGVFVAYHNTARMFGFQYVPVAEMEERLYGPGPPGRGDRIFEKCVGLMEVLVAHIVDYFPGEVSPRLVVHSHAAQ